MLSIARPSTPAGAFALAADFPGPQFSGANNDAHLAVGPSSLLVATNDRIAIYSKAGQEVAATDTFASFKRTYRYERHGDPRALYDAASGRFFVFLNNGTDGCVGAADCPNDWNFAVSKTSTPQTLGPSSWYFYTFDGRLENGQATLTWGDYGQLIVGRETVGVIVDMLTSDRRTFWKIWLFDKQAFLEGRPVSRPVREFVLRDRPELSGAQEHVVAAVLHTDPGVLYLVWMAPGMCDLIVGGIQGPPAAATLTFRGVRASSNCAGGFNMTSPQGGGGATIIGFPGLASAPAYRDGRMWIAHTVAIDSGGTTVRGVRLIELDLSGWPETPNVVGNDILADPGVWYFDASVAVSAAHDVAVVAQRVGLSEYPSLYYSGRLHDDPHGTLRPAAALAVGQAPWSGGPHVLGGVIFADYTGAAVDPIDGSAWLAGQYARTSNDNGVWIGRVDWNPVP